MQGNGKLRLLSKLHLIGTPDAGPFRFAHYHFLAKPYVIDWHILKGKQLVSKLEKNWFPTHQGYRIMGNLAFYPSCT